MAAQAHAGSTAQDGHQQGQAVRVDAGSGAPRAAVTSRRHESLNLHQQGPRALERCPGDAAGSVLVGGGQKRSARIDDLGQSALRHLEDAHFLRGAETILGRAEQPQGRGPLPFQVQHRVDEVFQRLGSGEGAVLGHMTDQDHRDPVSLGHLHQSKSAFADLADASGRPFEFVGGNGLDGVDDQRDRTRLAGKLDDSTDIRLRNDRYAIGRDAVEQTQPGCP